jgi:hypothetical protein
MKKGRRRKYRKEKRGKRNEKEKGRSKGER